MWPLNSSERPPPVPARLAISCGSTKVQTRRHERLAGHRLGVRLPHVGGRARLAQQLSQVLLQRRLVARRVPDVARRRVERDQRRRERHELVGARLDLLADASLGVCQRGMRGTITWPKDEVVREACAGRGVLGIVRLRWRSSRWRASRRLPVPTRALATLPSEREPAALPGKAPDSRARRWSCHSITVDRQPAPCGSRSATRAARRLRAGCSVPDGRPGAPGGPFLERVSRGSVPTYADTG